VTQIGVDALESVMSDDAVLRRRDRGLARSAVRGRAVRQPHQQAATECVSHDSVTSKPKCRLAYDETEAVRSFSPRRTSAKVRTIRKPVLPGSFARAGNLEPSLVSDPCAELDGMRVWSETRVYTRALDFGQAKR